MNILQVSLDNFLERGHNEVSREMEEGNRVEQFIYITQ